MLHKGNDARGSVVLQLFLGRGAGCRILSQATAPDGSPGWLAAFDGRAVPEDEAKSYVERLIARDPDVWVVELESPDGRHPFPGKEL